MEQNVYLKNLSSRLGFKVIGAMAGERLDKSISAGDFNGDGYDDLIIGSSYASPYGRPNAGITYVIFGKGSRFIDVDLGDLSANQGFSIYGALANDFSSHSFDCAGDINGDGYDDIIIGAREADPYGRTNAGTSYVIFGKSSGFTNIDLAHLSTSQGFSIYGAAINDWNGCAVSGVGDINGDGYDDIAVGSVFGDKYGRTDSGITYVIFGKATNFNNIDLAAILPVSQGFAIYGANTGDCNGHSLTKGDFNNDGYSDIIIGAAHADPYGRNDAGITYVIFGKSSGFNNIDLASLTYSQGFAIYGAAAGDLNGYSSMSKASDINNDGYDDISISSYGSSPYGKIEAGATYVIYGASSANVMNIDLGSLISSKGFRIAGAVAGDDVGLPAASFGDINDDGYVDLIVSSMGGENPHCYIIYGPVDGNNIDLGGNLDANQVLKIYSENPSQCFSAGDINKDGFTDIVVVDSNLDINNRIDAGVAYIIFGESSTFIPTTSPTNTPTLLPTKNPTQTPTTFYTDVSVSVPNYSGSEKNENFIINIDSNNIVTGGGGCDKYTFFSHPAVTTAITDFSNGCCTIDLRNIDISSYQDLELSYSPIVVTLPNNQKIAFQGINEISEGSFILSSIEPSVSPTVDTINSESYNDMDIPVWKQDWFWGMVAGIAAVISTIGGCISCCLSSEVKAAGAKVYQAVLPPIGISLDGNEIEIVKFNNSTVKFDYNNNANPVKTSWVGAKDAILVYDHNDNRKVDFAKEIVLTEWCADAKTDFEALLFNFDSNKDKIFNKEDQEFSKFYLWQDKNQDGVSQNGELRSLEEAGILSIDFNTEEEIYGELRELGALNKAEVLWEDGNVTYAYDLVFTHD